MLACALAMAGCKGDTGDRGPAGATGPTGPSGTGTTTGESCEICHGTGAVADVAVVHPQISSTNQDLVITVNSVTQDATNHPVIAFSVADSNGNSVDLTSGGTLNADGDAVFRIADLIPAGTGTNTYSSDYWEQWAAETPGTAAQLVDCAADTAYDSTTGTCVASPGARASLAHPATASLDVSDATNGNYSYTFATAFGSAWPGYNNADYAAGNNHRVAVEMSSPPTGYNNAVGIEDFTGVPAADGVTPATSVPSVHQVVTIEACRKCHGPLMEGAAHAIRRNDIRDCDLCHSALYQSLPRHAVGFMADANADLPVFIHAIHASSSVNNDGTTQYVGPTVTFPVTYPQGLVEGGTTKGVRNCTVCHSDPSGTAPGDLSALDNWKTNPNMRACMSCHTTVKFDGTQFVGLDGETKTHIVQSNDSGCSACHVPDGGSSTASPPSIAVAHDPSLGTDYDPTADMNAPEFDVTLTVTNADGTALTDAAGTYMTNGGYFKPGDTFIVTATLKNHATGADVDPSLYTTAEDAAYVAGGGLHVASLYVYGPRSDVVPLLTNGGAYQQGLALFVGTPAIDDATVTTSSSGFSAQVTVPSGQTSGTYMIRTRFGDYDYDRTNPTGGGAHTYQIESYALQNIQIGTATVQNKVDGNSCVNCHGTTKFHVDDHAAPFDTDQCTACHDRSGGFADFIGNRVHAIHSANSTGDLQNYSSDGTYTTADPPSRDWADITFPLGSINPAVDPQDITSNERERTSQLCAVCHTPDDNSGTFKTNPYGSVCIGCHGDNNGVNSHLQQNGFSAF